MLSCDDCNTNLRYALLGWAYPVWFFYVAVKGISEIRDKAEAEIESYKKKRMRLRCGSFYIGT